MKVPPRGEPGIVEKISIRRQAFRSRHQGQRACPWRRTGDLRSSELSPFPFAEVLPDDHQRPDGSPPADGAAGAGTAVFAGIRLAALKRCSL